MYTYEKKLNKLVQLEEDFVKADLNDKNNRLAKQRYCRFKGRYYSQSFFMLDYEDFKEAREIYFNIDKQLQKRTKDDDEFII